MPCAVTAINVATRIIPRIKHTSPNSFPGLQPQPETSLCVQPFRPAPRSASFSTTIRGAAPRDARFWDGSLSNCSGDRLLAQAPACQASNVQFSTLSNSDRATQTITVGMLLTCRRDNTRCRSAVLMCALQRQHQHQHRNCCQHQSQWQPQPVVLRRSDEAVSTRPLACRLKTLSTLEDVEVFPPVAAIVLSYQKHHSMRAWMAFPSLLVRPP